MGIRLQSASLYEGVGVFNVPGDGSLRTRDLPFIAWSELGLKRVLEYSDSGKFQTSTRYFTATRVLGIFYIDK